MGLDRMLLGTRLGDPDQEVLGAWLAKESMRDVYLTADAADAELVLDKAIEGCRLDAVEEGALARGHACPLARRDPRPPRKPAPPTAPPRASTSWSRR